MKILITPRSFGKHSDEAIRLLKSRGISFLTNDTGGILTEAQMKEKIRGCDGIVIGVDPLTAEVLAEAPSLKAVAKYGVGVDNIDLDYCAARGIKVSTTVGANSEAVADFAFSLMLALARKTLVIDSECRKGNWGKITTTDVYGKTLGLIGLGAIGRNMVRRAVGFSMRVIAYDVNWDEAYAADAGVERADAESVLRESDFVSLHLPLLPETKGFIGRERLALMKADAFLINTARGGLIDDEALFEALSEGRIGGAGLDVFEHEPPENEAWFALKNVVIGSHCAASTTGAADQMSIMSAQNIIRDLL